MHQWISKQAAGPPAVRRSVSSGHGSVRTRADLGPAGVLPGYRETPASVSARPSVAAGQNLQVARALHRIPLVGLPSEQKL